MTIIQQGGFRHILGELRHCNAMAKGRTTGLFPLIGGNTAQMSNINIIRNRTLPKDMSKAALLDYCHAQQDPATCALYSLETKIEMLHVSKIAYYASFRADHADAIQDRAHVDGGS